MTLVKTSRLVFNLNFPSFSIFIHQQSGLFSQCLSKPADHLRAYRMIAVSAVGVHSAVCACLGQCTVLVLQADQYSVLY